MQDAWRAYLELAMGLTEASRRKAEQVAKDLRDRSGATAAQAQSLVEELLATSRANRAELTKLVRYEVERALGAVGLARAEEVEQLSGRVRELERRMRESAGVPGSAGVPAARGDAPAAGAPTPAKKAAKQPAKKVATKKVAAKKAAAKKTGSAGAKKQSAG